VFVTLIYGEYEMATVKTELEKKLENGTFEEMFNLGKDYLNQENFDSAVKAFTQAIQVNPNFAKAYRGIAICYSKQNDKKLKFEWMKKSAELGDDVAQYIMGLNYKYGWDVEKNQEFAFECFKKAAEQGNVDAQYELAECYLKGEGVEENPEIAFKCFKKSAYQGHIASQYELGMFYLSYEFVKNTKLGLDWLRKVANQGNKDAERSLYDYFIQDKENENLEQYLQWFQEKAEQGDIEAYYLLAQVYFKGTKVKKNRMLALEWLEKFLKLEEAKEEPNKYILANILLDFAYGFETEHSEIKISSEKIIELYVKSAEYGSANACIRLADYYRLGNHIEKNDELAFKYYEKAHEIGKSYPVIVSLAALQLSHYYAKGNIVKKDAALVESYKKQIDEIIITTKNTIKFPYKSDILAEYSGVFDDGDGVGKYENAAEGMEKADYLAIKGKFDESRKYTWDMISDGNEYILEDIINERPEKIKELYEKNKQLELEIQQKEAAQKIVEEKNKQLLEKEKELEDMMSMFAHKFRSPLDAIIYNTTHDKDPKLYIEAAQTMRGLLDVFSIISTDDKILKEKIKADNQGNARLITVLSKTLDMILLHLLSKAGTEKIQQHYLKYAKAQGKVAESITPKEWYNDYFELERDLQSEWEQSFSQLLRQSASLEQRLDWIEQHFFKLDIIGFERNAIQFKEYATTESFLTILLNETLVNVFKYYSCETQQPVILEWSERDGNQILSCRNPSIRGIKSKGSGKGHVFLSALARKIGTQFVKPKLQDDFVLEFSIPNELLLSNATGEK
jgi:TPR repeat protein